MTSHYLLAILGDVEPEIIAGPATESEILAAARAHRHSDPHLRDGLFYLDIDDHGKPSVFAFSGGDFDAGSGLVRIDP